MKTALFLVFFCFELQAAVLDPSKGRTEFKAVGRPAAIKIVGEGAGPEGEIKTLKAGDDLILSGEVQVNLDSLKTGISLRDDHMKEKYLETGKFKTAILKFKDNRLQKATLLAGEEIKTTAQLVFRQIEKPVEIILRMNRENETFKILSQFQMRLSDFQVPVPTYAGITVADFVDVKVETKLSEDPTK